MRRTLMFMVSRLTLLYARHLYQLGEEAEQAAILKLEDATEYKTRSGRIRERWSPGSKLTLKGGM